MAQVGRWLKISDKVGWFIPQSLPVRRALGAVIAMLVAIVADHQVSSLHQVWIPLITVVLLLSTPRLDLRAMLMNFGIMVMSLCAVWGVVDLHIPVWGSNALIFTILLVAFVVENISEMFASTCLIPAVLYLFWQQYWPIAPLYDLLHDAGIALMICGAVTLFVYPGREDVDFRRGLAPVFSTYREYLHSIVETLFHKELYEQIAFARKMQVMKMLQEEESFFPEWVYDFGFSAFFRQGHRHFLVRTEQIGAVLFAMHQIAREDMNEQILELFKNNIVAATSAIDSLFQAIIARLKLDEMAFCTSGLEAQIVELDKALMQIAPPSIDLLDVSEDYLRIAGFIYEIKDLQQLLVKLVEALR